MRRSDSRAADEEERPRRLAQPPAREPDELHQLAISPVKARANREEQCQAVETAVRCCAMARKQVQCLCVYSLSVHVELINGVWVCISVTKQSVQPRFGLGARAQSLTGRSLFLALNGVALVVLLGLCVSMHSTIMGLQSQVAQTSFSKTYVRAPLPYGLQLMICLW